MSYAQLIGKLQDHAETHSHYARTEMRQLVQVFQRWKEREIELSLFDLPGHIGNFRMAACYKCHIVFDTANEEEADKIFGKPSSRSKVKEQQGDPYLRLDTPQELKSPISHRMAPWDWQTRYIVGELSWRQGAGANRGPRHFTLVLRALHQRSAAILCVSHDRSTDSKLRRVQFVYAQVVVGGHGSPRQHCHLTEPYHLR
jgi:hypothetical protein